MLRIQRRKVDRPRRIYYNERVGLGAGRIIPYLTIEEFRVDDDWMAARDRLRDTVRKKLLKGAPFFPLGSISLYAVWNAIVPSVRPSHWITAGFRLASGDRTKVPIIQIPVSIGTTDEAIIIGGPVFFAIDALPVPASLELTQRDRAVFSLTLLSALSIAVRDRMVARRV